MGDNQEDRTVSKPEWWDTPPAWVANANHPATNIPQESDRAPERERGRERDYDRGSRRYGADGELLDAINALPERLVTGLREALTGSSETKPPKKEESSEDKTETKTQTKKETAKEPGGKKSFADRWFN